MMSIDYFLAKAPQIQAVQPTEEKSNKATPKKEKRHFHKRKRSFNEELNRVHKRVSGFVVNDSHAWKSLTNRFGEKLTQNELISIAELIADTANIKLDRDAKRRKIVLIKWFEEHWAQVEPYLSIITLD